MSRLTDEALDELEEERAVLEQMRQQLLRTVAQLQVEESDLLAQMTALSAPTATAGLREELHAELFGSSETPSPPPEARSILDALIAHPQADGALNGEDEEDDEDEEQRWLRAQESLRSIDAAAAGRP